MFAAALAKRIFLSASLHFTHLVAGQHYVSSLATALRREKRRKNIYKRKEFDQQRRSGVREKKRRE